MRNVQCYKKIAKKQKKSITDELTKKLPKYFCATAEEHAEDMVSKGVDIIDIGAESTRPQAKPLTFDEEIEIPVQVNGKVRAIVKVSKEALDRFYDLVKPVNGSRWYDKDPIISKTVEILRVVPPEVQHACAERFISAIKEMGIEYESPNNN